MECIDDRSDGSADRGEDDTDGSSEIEKEGKDHITCMAFNSYIHEGSIFGDQEMVEDGSVDYDEEGRRKARSEAERGETTGEGREEAMAGRTEKEARRTKPR
jgi:hypothetical protein